MCRKGARASRKTASLIQPTIITFFACVATLGNEGSGSDVARPTAVRSSIEALDPSGLDTCVHLRRDSCVWLLASFDPCVYPTHAIDTSNKAQPVLGATLVLRDSTGKVLARGTSDARFGVVRFAHPHFGSCEDEEKTASTSSDGRSRWDRCIGEQFKWQAKLAPQVRTVDVEFSQCQKTESSGCAAAASRRVVAVVGASPPCWRRPADDLQRIRVGQCRPVRVFLE